MAAGPSQLEIMVVLVVIEMVYGNGNGSGSLVDADGILLLFDVKFFLFCWDRTQEERWGGLDCLGMIQNLTVFCIRSSLYREIVVLM